MDTPGGLDTSMRDIIQRILESNAPVAVYVTPGGARAASAGFFILLAADIAAMAPGTHTGAASPLLSVGGYPVQMDETLKNKILNDATAYLRSYARARGRNIEMAETAITDAKAFTEREALEGKLIDTIASSRGELLAALDGRTVTRFNGRTATVSLTTPDVISVEMTARQRFLTRIVEPDMFFILLLVGVLGLYVEFTNPGMIAPGVIGSIAIVLALFAMHLLPINLTGVALIALARTITADGSGRHPGRGARRDAPLRSADDLLDASGAAVASVGTARRRRALDRRRRQCDRRHRRRCQLRHGLAAR
jgi:membrane-bound serine protease (ClpP class)